jgi:hypothetical protein
MVRPRILPAVLATLVLAACSTGPTAAPPNGPTPGAPSAPSSLAPASPSAGASTLPSPSPEPSPTGPTAALCEPADVKVSHGLVEGTAGSRNTEVILVTAISCAVPAWPTFGIRDVTGQALIAGPAGGPGYLTLFAGQPYASAVRVANWCGLDPSFPLTLELLLGANPVAVEGGSFPDEGDMPPCTANQTPLLEGTAWTPVP